MLVVVLCGLLEKTMSTSADKIKGVMHCLLSVCKSVCLLAGFISAG